jgi:hypothetical protein
MPFWLLVTTIHPECILAWRFLAVSSVPGDDAVFRIKAASSQLLILLNDINRAYFYEAIGTTSITGSLSYLLCVTDEQLMAIYRYCGFYNVKRNCF